MFVDLFQLQIRFVFFSEQTYVQTEISKELKTNSFGIPSSLALLSPPFLFLPFQMSFRFSLFFLTSRLNNHVAVQLPFFSSLRTLRSNMTLVVRNESMNNVSLTLHMSENHYPTN